MGQPSLYNEAIAKNRKQTEREKVDPSPLLPACPATSLVPSYAPLLHGSPTPTPPEAQCGKWAASSASLKVKTLHNSSLSPLRVGELGR